MATLTLKPFYRQRGAKHLRVGADAPRCRPVTYKPELAVAVYRDLKTQTRRIIKFPRQTEQLSAPPHHVCADGAGDWIAWYGQGGGTAEQWQAQTLKLYPDGGGFRCPYGKPGDQLWVKEEHYVWGHWQENGTTKTGATAWAFYPVVDDKPAPKIRVRFSDDPPPVFRRSRDKKDPGTPTWYKRSATFMPRAYARSILEITGVRAERVNAITEADAVAEGVAGLDLGRGLVYRDYLHPDPDVYSFIFGDAYASFISLWEKIHGAEAWAENPWVFVIIFRRLLLDV